MYENIHKIHATQWEMEKCRKFFTQFDICLIFGSFSALSHSLFTASLFPLCHNQSLLETLLKTVLVHYLRQF